MSTAFINQDQRAPDRKRQPYNAERAVVLDISVTIRTAKRDDISQIVEAHCSDVREWFHWSKVERGERASYDELKDWERAMHGGDYMDASLLNRSWDEHESYGIVPLVAELDGKVVGHLDIIESRESPFGRFLWLDVLMVHVEHRRKGIATALVNAAEEIAKRKGLGAVLVSAQEYEGPSEAFYRSLGFERFQELHTIEIDCTKQEVPSDVALVSIRLNQEPPLDTHEMICGRANISQKMWRFGQLQRQVYYPLIYHDVMLAAVTKIGTYYIRTSAGGFRGARGYLTLWSPLTAQETHLDDMVSLAKTLAFMLGAGLLESTVLKKDIEKLVSIGFADKGKSMSPLMRKPLRPDSK